MPLPYYGETTCATCKRKAHYAHPSVEGAGACKLCAGDVPKTLEPNPNKDEEQQQALVSFLTAADEAAEENRKHGRRGTVTIAPYKGSQQDYFTTEPGKYNVFVTHKINKAAATTGDEEKGLAAGCIGPIIDNAGEANENYIAPNMQNYWIATRWYQCQSYCMQLGSQASMCSPDEYEVFMTHPFVSKRGKYVTIHTDWKTGKRFLLRENEVRYFRCRQYNHMVKDSAEFHALKKKLIENGFNLKLWGLNVKKECVWTPEIALEAYKDPSAPFEYMQILATLLVCESKAQWPWKIVGAPDLSKCVQLPEVVPDKTMPEDLISMEEKKKAPAAKRKKAKPGKSRAKRRRVYSVSDEEEDESEESEDDEPSSDEVDEEESDSAEEISEEEEEEEEEEDDVIASEEEGEDVDASEEDEDDEDDEDEEEEEDIEDEEDEEEEEEESGADGMIDSEADESDEPGDAESEDDESSDAEPGAAESEAQVSDSDSEGKNKEEKDSDDGLSEGEQYVSFEDSDSD